MKVMNEIMVGTSMLSEPLLLFNQQFVTVDWQNQVST